MTHRNGINTYEQDSFVYNINGLGPCKLTKVDILNYLMLFFAYKYCYNYQNNKLNKR